MGPFATQQSLFFIPYFQYLSPYYFLLSTCPRDSKPYQIGIFFNPLLYPQCLEQCQAIVDTQSMFVEWNWMKCGPRNDHFVGKAWQICIWSRGFKSFLDHYILLISVMLLFPNFLSQSDMLW